MPTPKKSVLLVADESTSIQVDALAQGLNRICKYLRFAAYPNMINLGSQVVSKPSTYDAIADQTAELLKKHIAVVIATDLPYENNYFFESCYAVTVVSFHEWSLLTSLPKNNGMIGFICNILSQDLDSSVRHHENTGCVYDVLYDKRGIDAWLRNGVICRSCDNRLRARVKQSGSRQLSYFDCTMSEGLGDLMEVLDEVSMASKRQVDVIDRWKTKAGVHEEFDVFLCHNSEDKPSVRDIYQGLLSRKITPWFDEEDLQPGLPWQDELEKAIPRIRSAAIMVGQSGQGPWQSIELRAIIGEFADRGCSVTPVILPDARTIPRLPVFLRQYTWVDFRKSDPDPWRRLIWGITGQKPE